MEPLTKQSTTPNNTLSFMINVSSMEFSGPRDEWPNILEQVPKDVKLYPHQVDAVRWMYEREKGLIPGDGGIVLGDVMGLGKTRMTCTVLSLNPPKRALLVCGKSLICQWVRELVSQNHTVYFLEPAFARTIDVSRGKVIFGKKKLEHKDLEPPFVAVTTYGKTKPFPEPNHEAEKVESAYDCAAIGSNCDRKLVPFRKIKFGKIIVDEAHALRNGISLTGDASAQLRKKSLRFYRMLRLRTTSNVNRLCLTGTPLQNRIGDLASMFLFLDCYISRMTSEIDLAKLIKTNMFRRNTSNIHPVLKQLMKFPTEQYNENKIIVEYETEKEKNFYIMAAGRLEERLKIAMGYYKDIQTEDNMLALLTLLRLLSSHPAAFIKAHNKRYLDKQLPKWKGSVSKLNMIEKQLQNYYNTGESCIVFVHYYQEAEMIGMLDTGYKHIEYLTGQTSMEDRDYVVHKSKRIIAKGGIFLIIANIIACGEGLNLQHFKNVIIASINWNPAAEEQAIARVYRIGSEGKVNVTRYYHKEIIDATNTFNIDSFMKKKQDDKKLIAERLIDNTPNAAWDYQITHIPGYDLPSAIYPVIMPDQPNIDDLEWGDEYLANSPNRTKPPGKKTTKAKKIPVPTKQKEVKYIEDITSESEEDNVTYTLADNQTQTNERTATQIMYNSNFIIVGSERQYNCLRLSNDELIKIEDGKNGPTEAVQVKAILLDDAFWQERDRLASMRRA